jgi:hypothetical protein
MPGESREPFLVIVRQEPQLLNIPPTETQSQAGLPDFHLPVLKDVGNSNGNIACECV